MKMVVTVKLSHGNVQEYQKKVLKNCIVEALVLLQKSLVISNFEKWNLKESV